MEKRWWALQVCWAQSKVVATAASMMALISQFATSRMGFAISQSGAPQHGHRQPHCRQQNAHERCEMEDGLVRNGGTVRFIDGRGGEQLARPCLVPWLPLPLCRHRPLIDSTRLCLCLCLCIVFQAHVGPVQTRPHPFPNGAGLHLRAATIVRRPSPLDTALDATVALASVPFGWSPHHAPAASDSHSGMPTPSH